MKFGSYAATVIACFPSLKVKRKERFLPLLRSSRGQHRLCLVIAVAGRGRSDVEAAARLGYSSHVVDIVESFAQFVQQVALIVVNPKQQTSKIPGISMGYQRATMTKLYICFSPIWSVQNCTVVYTAAVVVCCIVFSPL